MNVSTFNCQGYKGNCQMVKNVISSNDFTFLVEHWLTHDQQNLLDDASFSHTVYNFQSDMPISSCALSRRGRPFGGRCWFIKNDIQVKSHETVDDILSILEVEVCHDDVNTCMLMIGIWIAFDDNSAEKMARLRTTLSALESSVHAHKVKYGDAPVVIVGDFNADLKRDKRFDRALGDFLAKNSLFDGVSLFPQEYDYTWSNGANRATLDHIILNTNALCKTVQCTITDNSWNLSDHRPVQLTVNLNPYSSEEQNSPAVGKRFHKFDWDDDTFLLKYRTKLNSLLESTVTTHCRETATHAERVSAVNFIFESLPKILLKACRSSETSRAVRRNRDNKIYKTNPDVERAFVDAKQWHEVYKATGDQLLHDQWVEAKRRLRTAQRVAIFKSEQVRSINLEKLFHENRACFWKKISSFKKKEFLSRFRNSQP